MVGRDRIGRVCRLQWGHGREAMDGGFALRARYALVQLQWGHGREAMDGVLGAPWVGLGLNFNGAMAVRPWMVVWPPDLHDRGATSMGPWP